MDGNIVTNEIFVNQNVRDSTSHIPMGVKGLEEDQIRKIILDYREEWLDEDQARQEAEFQDLCLDIFAEQIEQ